MKSQKMSSSEYKIKLLWRNVILFLILHLCLPYALYLGFISARWRTWIFTYIYGNLSMLGITAGAHRLWSHRCYKARLPLRIILSIMYSMSGQMELYRWCRDHRLHHKYDNTNADPYTMSRGFFFAHIGWILCKEHPDVTAKESTINIEDLLADPVIRFNKKFRYPLDTVFAVLLPLVVPILYWGESPLVAFFAVIARHIIFLHVTFLINSVAHYYGYRPFDKGMTAAENPICSFMALGEGWHNYHHTFPSDYSTSELGYKINFSKIFIDLMAMIGQAYDLQVAPSELVKSRKRRTGDGSR